MESHRRRFRRGLVQGLLAILGLALGCASTPVAPDAKSTAPRVFASIDEAALAGLTAARSNATLGARQSIRVGAIRKVAGGYVWLRPHVADAGLHAGRPGVVRFRITAEDVATYVVHPATGDGRIDRANTQLSVSERRLLEGASGRSRPVFLLTPRLEVVRFSREGTPEAVAKLRGSRWDSLQSGPTAHREGGSAVRECGSASGGACRSDQRVVAGQRPA
jgi:hypothetical protein